MEGGQVMYRQTVGGQGVSGWVRQGVNEWVKQGEASSRGQGGHRCTQVGGLLVGARAWVRAHGEGCSSIQDDRVQADLTLPTPHKCFIG